MEEQQKQEIIDRLMSGALPEETGYPLDEVWEVIEEDLSNDRL